MAKPPPREPIEGLEEPEDRRYRRLHRPDPRESGHSQATHREALLRRALRERGFTTTEAREAVEIIFDTLAERLVEGESVSVRGFGSFAHRLYPNGYQAGRVIRTPGLTFHPTRRLRKKLAAAYRKGGTPWEPTPEPDPHDEEF